jgi:hypothetical protein
VSAVADVVERLIIKYLATASPPKRYPPVTIQVPGVNVRVARFELEVVIAVAVDTDFISPMYPSGGAIPSFELCTLFTPYVSSSHAFTLSNEGC